MKKLSLGILVLAIILMGAYKQRSSPPARGSLTIRFATRTHRLEGALAGLAKWDKNGFIINFLRERGQPLIWVHNRKGQLVCRLSPIDSFPDVRSTGLNDIAITKDGTVLVALLMTNMENHRAAALLEYNVSGTLRRIIKTDPFAVEKIAIDDENNIWVLGYDWQKSNKNLDYELVAKISTQGVHRISALPTSLFPKGTDPLSAEGGLLSEPFFEVVGGEVYAWLPGAKKIVVLSLDGQVLRTVDDPLRTLFDHHVTQIEVLSLVFLPQDRLFIDTLYHEGEEPRRGWFFSPDLGQSWKREPPRVGCLIGFSGPTEAVVIRFTTPRMAEFYSVEF